MPQVTLSAYFKPLQTASARLSINPEDQTGQATLQPTSILELSREEKFPSPTVQKDVKVAASIRELAKPGIRSHASLDFFTPPGIPQAAIVKVLQSHIARVKSITSTLLPIRYSDKFFNESFENSLVENFSRVLLWNSQPVGWIRCQLEEDEHGLKQLYIQALGVLAPYRGYGLATYLLEQVIQPALVHEYTPTSIYCHVWRQNDNALEWYEKRGFKRIILLEQYYRRLRPAGAWIMRKELT